MDYQLGPGPLQVDQNTIDEKIKGDIGIVENGDVATHAITSGYYVIWKGDLYVAKTDISSGTTLSAASNGNLTTKTNGLGAEVAALNSNFTTVHSTPEIKDQFFGTDNVAYGSVACFKIGHIGILKINVRFNGSASLSGKIGSVPTDYRPSTAFTFNLTSPVATDNGGYFELTAQGDVMCYSSPSIGSQFYSICIPYFVAE